MVARHIPMSADWTGPQLPIGPDWTGPQPAAVPGGVSRLGADRGAAGLEACGPRCGLKLGTAPPDLLRHAAARLCVTTRSSWRAMAPGRIAADQGC